MPYGVIVRSSRKAGLSPAEFKDYYENNHEPLIKSLTGDFFPKTYVRYYMARQPGTSDPPNAPLILMGPLSEASWDAIAVLTFEDEEHFNKFSAVTSEEEAATSLRVDEDKFTDRSSLSMVLLGDMCEAMNEPMQ